LQGFNLSAIVCKSLKFCKCVLDVPLSSTDHKENEEVVDTDGVELEFSDLS